jgi:hypothetical protein
MDTGLRYEIWTPANSGDFKRKADITPWVLPGSTLDLRFVDLSTGTLIVQQDCPVLGQILTVDRADHTNDVASALMVFRGSTLIATMVPTRRTVSVNETEPWVTYQVDGLEWYLDKARIKAFDNPADPIREGDWLYGAPTVLTPAGGEISDAQWFMWIEGASTGNYAITDGTDTTDDIPFDTTDPATIATRLETDIAAITDVLVSGSGTLANKFLIILTDPAETDLTLTEAAPSGAAHDGTLIIDQTRVGGSLSPRPWHGSIDGNTGVIIGNYQQFDMVEVSTGGAPAAPGGSASTHLLRIDADTPDNSGDYAGGQIEVDVPWGHRHRASINVYSETAQTIRFVIRTLTEGLISFDEQDLSPDTWTLMSIPEFTLNEGTGTIVYRVGIIVEGNADIVYLDVNEAVLAPGTAAANLGEIASDVLVPITGRGVLDWIVETWDATNDSGAVAWDRDLSQGLRKGQSLMQFLEYESRWGYERAFVYNGGTVAPFDLGLFNPGGRDSNPADVSVSAIDGMVAASPVEEAAPGFTTAIAEGADGRWGEFTDADLATAWGKLEGYFANKQGRDSDNLDALAAQMVADSATETVSHSATVQNPSKLFGDDFVIGDTIPVALHAADGSITPSNLRLVSCVITKTKTLPTYQYSFGAVVFDPEAAQADAVRSLIRRFQALDETGGDLGVVDPVGVGVRGAGTGASNARGAFLHLSRAATQSIGTSGDAIDWDILGVGSYLGFDPTPTDEITIPQPGYYNIAVQAGWSSFSGGGSVTVVRTASGIPLTVWPPADDPGLWSTTDGQVFEGTAHAIKCETGDTIQVLIDADDVSAQTLASATLAVYLVDSIAVSSGYREMILGDGPIAYWRLGELSTSDAAYDETGNGHDGTYTAGVVLGRPGALFGDANTAALYDEITNDSTDVAITSDLKLLNTDFTLEVWVNITATLSTNRTIFCRVHTSLKAEWGIEVEQSGSDLRFIGVRDHAAVATSGYDFALNTFYHVVVTYDAASNDMVLYVNAVQRATGSQATTLDDTAEPVRIGRNDLVGIDGDVDEVAVYGRVLTTTEIADHYRVGTQGS